MCTNTAIGWIKLTVVICAFAAVQNARAEAYILELEVVNVQAGEGFLKIVLHDSESSYRDGDQIPFRSITVPVDREEHMTLQIEGVPPGRYAFIVYQDLNGNDDIDSNFIGWPKEPFGFSNNPPIRFGPPSFKKTSFEVTNNQRVRVELR
ncbi:MAG: DUF2141 domain-containing protein [Gammaproteobacteria bacterium]|nr:DUF2141 domain-containing protein [Gammaproteobacteria bacterium]